VAVFPLIPEPSRLRVIWDTSASNQFEVRVKKKRFTEEQIAYALAQQSMVQTIAEVCRRLGVPFATASSACLSLATTSSGRCRFLFERFIGDASRSNGP
jgi:aryl-alcohol dehydrogenase-like predicted oxidoreductase